MLKLLSLAVVSILAPTILTAVADDACGSEGEPALGIVQVTSGREDATFYVDDRNGATGNGLWLYQESNGLWTPKAAGVIVGDEARADLQRGFAWCEFCRPFYLEPDPCWDESANEYGPDFQVV